MKTHLIEFKNNNDNILRGFFHEPTTVSKERKDLIVFPNGGLMGCEGDFRAYVRMSRYLAMNGFYVFRFSPHGLGYSDGEIGACRRNDLFTKIETGLFVEDIKYAIDFIQLKMQFDSISISGVCGGAISAFIAASQINCIDNVIPIGMPTILDSDDVDYSVRMPKEHAKFILKTYTSKLFSPKAWWRFIRGKSDSKTIKMIVNKLFKFKKEPSVPDDSEKNLTTNPEFYKAARTIIGKKNILFIYGDTDWIYWEFENHFNKKYYPDLKLRPYDTYLINNGNHMLTWVEMQQEASEKISQWLKEKTKI